MLIDFSQALFDKANDGEALKVPTSDGKGEEVLTLGAICRKALTAQLADDKAEGTEKVDRYFLAQRIKTAAGPIETTAEEAANLKKLINKAYGSPVIVGECWPLLDGKGKPKEEKPAMVP